MKKALLIACTYEGGRAPLPGTLNDANKMISALKRDWNYKDENILLLTDKGKIPPTKVNIEKALNWCTNGNNANEFDSGQNKKMEKNTTVVVYYSGHGEQRKDTSGDEKDGKDECICPIDAKRSSEWISDDYIRENVNDKMIPESKLVYFFDACHSGTVTDLRWYTNGNILMTNRNYQRTPGTVYCLSGCLDHQVSIESWQLGYPSGVFTNKLIENMDKIKKGKSMRWVDFYLNCKSLLKSNKITEQIPTLSVGLKISNIYSVFEL